MDAWIASTFALLFVIIIWAALTVKRQTKRASKTNHTPREATETTLVEAQAALLQALEANEHQKEQIEAVTRDLAEWSEMLRTEPPNASIERLLSAIKHSAAQTHALVAKLHQQAKSKQIKTLNQTLDDTHSVLDAASQAMIETMSDWLTHHQALHDQLDELLASCKALQTQHDSPGSVRNELNLKRIDGFSRTLDGLSRSLVLLGQDLNRVKQLMLGAR